jgi:hypothetical protein
LLVYAFPDRVDRRPAATSGLAGNERERIAWVPRELTIIVRAEDELRPYARELVESLRPAFERSQTTQEGKP